MGQLRQPFYFKVGQKLFQSEVETIISKWVTVCFKVGQKLFQSWAITSKWDKVLFQIRAVILTLFRMGFFGAAHGWEWGAFWPPSLKSASHILQWWNLAQLYLTLGRSKKCINHVTNPLSSADISIFSAETSKFCYIKKYTYTLEFDR